MIICNSVSSELMITVSKTHNYLHSGVQGAGDLRMNVATGNVEVYTGYMWEPVVHTMHAGVSSEVSAILSWARQKMSEEAEIARLAKSNAAVHAALDSVKKATEQLKTTIILANNEETTS